MLEDFTEQHTTERFINICQLSLMKSVQHFWRLEFYVGRTNKECIRFILTNSALDSIAIDNPFFSYSGRWTRMCFVVRRSYYSCCVYVSVHGLEGGFTRGIVYSAGRCGSKWSISWFFTKIKDTKTLAHGCVVPIQDTQQVGCYNNYFSTWSTAFTSCWLWINRRNNATEVPTLFSNTELPVL